MRSAAVIAALIVAAGGAPVVAQPTTGAFAAGGWVGEARFDEDRVFTHCVMVKAYPDGATLRFSLTADDVFLLGIDHPGWGAAERQASPVRLLIDDTGPIEAPALLSEGEVSAVFAAGADIIRRFRAGSVMTARLGDLSATFALTGTNAALPLLERCLQRFR